MVLEMSLILPFMPRIPGMRFIPNFLDKTNQNHILEKSLSLHERVNAAAQKETRRIYVSKGHNLKIEKSYQFLKINNQFCQYFGNYGENGHSLTYFQNNENIPPFVKEIVIDRMSELKEVQLLRAKNQTELNWKFTFNAYKTSQNHVAGFPFHKDISSNGEITAIITLIASAELQMKKPEEQTPSLSLQLIPGSIFLLSEEARWDWEHRVLPQQLKTTPVGDLARLSLVVGCQSINHQN